MRERERGVSEVVSFVIVFSLIILAVGTTYVAGLSGIQDARENEQVTNAQRAFDVLADNVDDLVDSGAPSRATSLKLTEASIGYGDPVTVNLTAGPDANVSYETRPLVYRANGGGEIVYVNGAVIRSESGGSVMTNPPEVLFGDRTLATLIVAQPNGRQSVGGSTQVLVRTTRTNRTVTTYDTGGSVTMNVTTPRPTAWRNAIESRPETQSCTVTDRDATAPEVTVSCTVETDSLVVRVVTLDVSLTS